MQYKSVLHGCIANTTMQYGFVLHCCDVMALCSVLHRNLAIKINLIKNYFYNSRSEEPSDYTCRWTVSWARSTTPFCCTLRQPARRYGMDSIRPTDRRSPAACGTAPSEVSFRYTFSHVISMPRPRASRIVVGTSLASTHSTWQISYRPITIVCYSLYGRFRPLPPSCLLAQWEISRLLRFTFAVQYCGRVIISFFIILFCFNSFSI